jgi:hypothetical protein
MFLNDAVFEMLDAIDCGLTVKQNVAASIIKTLSHKIDHHSDSRLPITAILGSCGI